MSDLIGALGALKGFLDESQARKIRIAGDETIDNYFFSDLDMDNSGVLDIPEVKFTFDIIKDYMDNGKIDEEHEILQSNNEQYVNTENQAIFNNYILDNNNSATINNIEFGFGTNDDPNHIVNILDKNPNTEYSVTYDENEEKYTITVNASGIST